MMLGVTGEGALMHCDVLGCVTKRVELDILYCDVLRYTILRYQGWTLIYIVM